MEEVAFWPGEFEESDLDVQGTCVWVCVWV